MTGVLGRRAVKQVTGDRDRMLAIRHGGAPRNGTHREFRPPGEINRHFIRST